jgi:hypothetical protein
MNGDFGTSPPNGGRSSNEVAAYLSPTGVANSKVYCHLSNAALYSLFEALLQRCLYRLSARLDHCRRTSAVRLYLAVLDISFLALDRPLRLCLRGDQHLRGLAAPRQNQLRMRYGNA